MDDVIQTAIPVQKEVYAQEPYLPLDRCQRDRQLSIVRERCRRVGKEIFEFCCRLQKQFDLKDAEEAFILIAELKALRAFEERLKQFEKVDLLRPAG